MSCKASFLIIVLGMVISFAQTAAGPQTTQDLPEFWTKLSPTEKNRMLEGMRGILETISEDVQHRIQNSQTDFKLFSRWPFNSIGISVHSVFRHGESESEVLFIVDSVWAGSPAEKVGIVKNDLVLQLNGAAPCTLKLHNKPANQEEEEQDKKAIADCEEHAFRLIERISGEVTLDLERGKGELLSITVRASDKGREQSRKFKEEYRIFVTEALGYYKELQSGAEELLRQLEKMGSEPAQLDSIFREFLNLQEKTEKTRMVFEPKVRSLMDSVLVLIE